MPVFSPAELWPLPLRWSSGTSAIDLAAQACDSTQCTASAQSLRYDLDSHGCCKSSSGASKVRALYHLAKSALRLDREATDRDKVTVADNEGACAQLGRSRLGLGPDPTPRCPPTLSPACAGCRLVWSKMEDAYPEDRRGAESVEPLYAAWSSICSSMTSVFVPVCREMEADAHDLVSDFALNVDPAALCTLYCAEPTGTQK